MSECDFQTLLDELTDAKNSLVQHNGYMPRQWVFGLIPRVPGHMLEENSGLPKLDPEGRFRRIAEMRTSVGWRPSRQRRMRRLERVRLDDRDPCEEITCLEIWCIIGEQELVCIKHKVSGWDQLGSPELKEETFGCHIVRQLSSAKEQQRMASLAEREMREMLMRIGRDDPDERSKHGVPRQQDLTQQPPPPRSPPQSRKKQPTKDPRQQQFHPGPGPQVQQDAPRHDPAHQRQVLDRFRNHSRYHDRKQRVRMKNDSPQNDGGRRKRLRVAETGPQKMETDQEPESEESDLPPVPEDDDLNATVIEVVTDIEVLLDDRCVCCELCAAKTCGSQSEKYDKE